MANNNYTHLVIDSLRNHEGMLEALHHLACVTPEEDSHFHMVSLLSESLRASFIELEAVTIKATACS